MKIVIGCDHAGFELKKRLTQFLITKGYEVIDVGTDSDEDVDYPIYGFKVGEEIVKNNCLGIAICGSGVGICIAANKIKGVRAVNANNIDLAVLSRLHNDANCLCLGARLLSLEEVSYIVDAFLNTNFEGDRHQKRVDLLNEK